MDLELDIFGKCFTWIMKQRYDTQHNYIQHNDIQHKDTQHKDTQQKEFIRE